MIVLGLDTSTTACSVALVEGERVRAARSEAMARGHQERLATLVQEMAGEAGLSFADLGRIGCTVGPGSFTGLRVGMAFAKAMGLALDVPAVGVGTLEALAATMREVRRTPTGGGASGESVYAAALDARRDQVYLQAFNDGRPLMDAQALSAADASSVLAQFDNLILAGSGAGVLAPHLPGAVVLELETPDPVVVARLAAAVTDLQPMEPMYLRAPDAKLPI